MNKVTGSFLIKFDDEDISESIPDPIPKAYVKYKSHPGTKAIKRVSKSNDLFSSQKYCSQRKNS